MDPRVRVFFRADQGQRFARNLATPRPAHTLETKPERDVIDYIEPWHQCVFLKYDTALGTGSNDRFTVQPCLPGSWIDETCEAVQQCRLTAPGGTERDHELAAVNLQIDALQSGRCRAFIGHAEAANVQRAHRDACCTKRGST